MKMHAPKVPIPLPTNYFPSCSRRRTADVRLGSVSIAHAARAAPVAKFAITMRYRGIEQTADIPLSSAEIEVLALEATWRDFKMKRERFALVTIAPATWLVVCTTTAGLEKVFSPNPSVGFISHALKYGEAIAAGQLLAPAKSAAEMTRIVVNDYIDATLAAVFVVVVAATVIYALINISKALASPRATAVEIGLAGAVAEGGHA